MQVFVEVKQKPFKTFFVPMSRIKCAVCGKNVLIKLFKVVGNKMERQPTPCELRHGAE